RRHPFIRKEHTEDYGDNRIHVSVRTDFGRWTDFEEPDIRTIGDDRPEYNEVCNRPPSFCWYRTIVKAGSLASHQSSDRERNTGDQDLPSGIHHRIGLSLFFRRAE